MNLKTALELGRVSNLPTVWTNTLAGAALASAPMAGTSLVLAAGAFSLFYVGGMYLNDAFDRDFDRQQQTFRPIPSGRVTARTVFVIGFVLLALGLFGVISLAHVSQHLLPATLAGLALASMVVFYDVHHKGNPLSPLVMGLCRVLVYITAGLALGGTLTSALMIGCVVLLAYLIGLTFVAKRGASGRVVGGLIAGICLVDALALWFAGQPVVAGVAILGFPLTRLLHRRVSGT